METTHDKALSPMTIILAFTALSIAYFIVSTYNAAFRGPLGKIPGPASRHLSIFPYIRDLISGRSVDTTVALHKKYGDVVRLGPNEVSFTSGETAWPDIYGFRTGKMKGHANMQKHPQWYGPPPNGAKSIIVANDVDHTRGRKVISHAFSERALMAQEPLLQDYVDQFINRLKEKTSADSEAVDMVKWYNWTTFDIIADLVFGEPFGCLQNMETHEYVQLLFTSLSAAMWISIFQYLPLFKTFRRFLVDSKILDDRVRYSKWIATKVAARKARGENAGRPDLMTDILANNGSKGSKLTDLEIDSNASLLITAGSETTATLLSGATYLLLRNPEKLSKLQEEIRAAFSSYDDINLDAVNRLPYTNAVLTESLRVFPPVPVGFVRQVGAGGEVISGHYIPEGTAVSVSQYAANHSEANFTDAEKFIPERWLEDSTYTSDKKSVLQPFSFGPRGCVGRSLANAEMRLILAKTIWSFDMQLEERSQDWLERCTVMRLWIKPELAVKLTQVERK